MKHTCFARVFRARVFHAYSLHVWPMLLCNLPGDIHACLLRYVDFEDWVSLTQTSCGFRAAFDSVEFQRLVYDNTFRESIRGYGFRPPSISKIKTIRIFRLLRLIPENRKLWDLSKTSDSLVAKALDLLQDPEAYHPIALLFRVENDRVRNAVALGATSVDFAYVALLTKLLDMQNFLVACDYFRGVDLAEPPAEEILFENSRFSADFIRYAPARQPCLDRINTVLDDLLPPVRGVYKFPTMHSFKHLLTKMAQVVLFQMNFPLKTRGSHPGSLCAYYHCGAWTTDRSAGVPYPLYVIGKFIHEKLHLRVEVRVGEEKVDTLPRVANGQLLVGPACFVFDDTGRLRLLDRLTLLRTGLLLTIHPNDDLNHVLHSHTAVVDLPEERDLSHVDWCSLLLCSSTKKKAALVESTRENNYDPTEYLAYSIFALQLYPSSCIQPSDYPIRFGHLVYNHFLHFVGIMTDLSPRNGYYTVALLNGDSSVLSRESSLTILSLDMIRRPADNLFHTFVDWMLLQANFIDLAGVQFTRLVVEDGFLRLV